MPTSLVVRAPRAYVYPLQMVPLTMVPASGLGLAPARPEIGDFGKAVIAGGVILLLGIAVSSLT